MPSLIDRLTKQVPEAKQFIIRDIEKRKVLAFPIQNPKYPELAKALVVIDHETKTFRPLILRGEQFTPEAQTIIDKLNNALTALLNS